MRSKRPLARQCKRLAKQYVDDLDVPAAPNGDSGYIEWVQIAPLLMRVELDKSLCETEAWFNDSTVILDEFAFERAPHYSSFCRWEQQFRI
jgi:IS5 family transposase